MYLPDVIDPASEFAVYGHFANGKLFYIGSGILSRAFDAGNSRRNEKWNIYVGGHPVSVFIFGRFGSRAEARRVEYEQIKKYRPMANGPYEASVPIEWFDCVVDGWQVARDPDLGTTIAVLPTGATYSNVRGAANAFGVSPSAVCNSISGRYPQVNGLQFFRVEVAQLGEWLRSHGL